MAPETDAAGYRIDWRRRNRLVAELTTRARHADATLVELVAGLIAGSASSDALLIAADALEDAADTLAMPGLNWHRLQAESLTVLVEKLRVEAPLHAAHGLFQAPAVSAAEDPEVARVAAMFAEPEHGD